MPKFVLPIISEVYKSCFIEAESLKDAVVKFNQGEYITGSIGEDIEGSGRLDWEGIRLGSSELPPMELAEAEQADELVQAQTKWNMIDDYIAETLFHLIVNHNQVFKQIMEDMDDDNTEEYLETFLYKTYGDKEEYQSEWDRILTGIQK